MPLNKTKTLIIILGALFALLSYYSSDILIQNIYSDESSSVLFITILITISTSLSVFPLVAVPLIFKMVESYRKISKKLIIDLFSSCFLLSMFALLTLFSTILMTLLKFEGGILKVWVVATTTLLFLSLALLLLILIALWGISKMIHEVKRAET